MAKSDFDIEEQEYDVVFDEEPKKKPFGLKKDSKPKSKKNATVSSNYSDDASDLGDFANNSNSDFDSTDESKSIVDIIKSINIRTLVVVLGIIIVLSVIVFMVVLTKVKSSQHYNSDIIIPDVLYVGESSGISVISEYNGENTPKKDITSTISSFETSNENVIHLVNKSIIGSDIMNVIIPVQEGRATLKVVSKLENKVLAEEEKEVLVCPKFDPTLLVLKNISIVKNYVYQIHLDMDEECAKGITYSSSNKNVAVVSDKGLINAFAPGKAILTMRKGDRTISMNITVVDDPISPEAFKANVNEIQLSVGEKYGLRLDYSPIDATGLNLRFNSDNEKIAKINSRGIIEAITPGTTTIRVLGSYSNVNHVINIIVTDKNQSGAFATELSLDSKSITLLQGESRKIKSSLKPNTINSEIVKWKSSDENTIYVSPSGVVYAKGVGEAVVTAYTDNGLSQDVKVKSNIMKAPSILSGDRIVSGKWHTKSYILDFSGSVNGAIYYYSGAGKSGSSGTRLIISRDENATHSVRYCTRICTSVCNSSNECTPKCSTTPYICSAVATYDSKLDTVKPHIDSVTDVQNSSNNVGIVQITFGDNMSGVSKWCVTSKNSFVYCKWKSVESNNSVKVTYASYKKGTFYAFAKDTAGNISTGYEFDIK